MATPQFSGARTLASAQNHEDTTASICSFPRMATVLYSSREGAMREQYFQQTKINEAFQLVVTCGAGLQVVLRGIEQQLATATVCKAWMDDLAVRLELLDVQPSPTEEDYRMEAGCIVAKVLLAGGFSAGAVSSRALIEKRPVAALGSGMNAALARQQHFEDSESSAGGEESVLSILNELHSSAAYEVLLQRFVDGIQTANGSDEQLNRCLRWLLAQSYLAGSIARLM